MFATLHQAAERHAETLSTGGWIMMILSIGAVTGLVVYCYKRILTHPEMDEPDLPGGLGP
ncbi:MAG: hypothetical protein H6835_12180 [Planctomycetes bacterium]|nr:hypothetical protein [Planctomycetota bacterium]